MDYSVGKTGRVVAIRFRDGEDVYAGVQSVAAKENIESAAVFAVGGAKRAKLVTGPKSPTGPIEPIVESFDDAREMIGIGTIFPSDGKPSLHLHGAFGRENKTLTGCPRLGLDAFLVLEVILVEMLGLNGSREPDQSGFRLLTFKKG